MDIRDQRNDPSRRVLVGIARSLADPELARAVLKEGMAEGESPAPTVKTAYAWPEKKLFPLDTPRDLLLSRAYFTGQREKIATDIAAGIDERIGVREILNGTIPNMTLREPEKNAACPVYELMPGVCATAEELEKAGADFEAGHKRLTYADRLAFAEGFARAAEREKLASLPDAVRVYAGRGRLRSARMLREHLALRKAAALRRGLDGDAYTRLGEALEDAALEEACVDDLRKLAAVIRGLDEEHGLAEGKAARRLPDASRLVFTGGAGGMEKNSESMEPGFPPPELTPEDVAARFGEGALEEVTNPDGTLNPRRVADVAALFGTRSGEAL